MRKLLLLILLTSQVAAQKPTAGFLQDSVEVGSVVQLSLSYLHNNTSDLVFPDSSYDFSPFVFVSSQFFETKKTNGLNRDSVVYTLVTYEVQDSFLLYPYVFDLSKQEKIFADTTRIYFKSQLDSKVDLNKINPKLTQKTYSIRKEYNIFKLFYILSGLLFFLFLGYAFFRDKIAHQLMLYKHYRAHRGFINEFKKISKNPEDPNSIYKTLTLWKGYLEKLTDSPITSMSTSEIVQLYQNESLESALKVFDQAIFGKVISEKINMAFHTLRDFAIKRYRYEMGLKQI